MENTNKNTGTKVHQKVLFVFFASCIALGLAYTISKVTFDDMLKTVDNIAKPNDKLRLVTRISRDILQLDQNQRSEFLLSAEFLAPIDQSYVSDSESIELRLDSLKSLYTNDLIQQDRIDSISSLLKKRNKLFLSYIQVRQSLINNSSFNSRIRNINKIIEDSPNSDKTIVTSTRKIRNTVSEVRQKESEEEEKKDSRGFFAKLFGKSKKETIKKEEVEKPKQTVHEELSVVIDTLRNEPKSKTKTDINSVIQDLEQARQLQSATFIDRESDLIIAGNILINSMIEILDEVELEANFQVTLDTRNAQEVVNQNVSKIRSILIIAILITGLLILLILNDIRRATRYRFDLEKAKEEAEYHSAAKQRFLSNMSHELRTPLQSIIGYTEQLDSSKIDHENIAVIHHASEHLLQIVNELLDYNRIISGKFLLNVEVLSVSILIKEVAETMQQFADKKKIKLKVTDTLTENDLVLGDSFRIKQILYNLISNAIKFTEKGEVRVAVQGIQENENTEIEILISDSGIGISEEDLSHIFSEFEQGKNHNSGNHFGSGLGLSIVKSLVDEMKGTISVTSTENIGSEFKVNLIFPRTTDTPLAISEKSNPFEKDDVKKVWIVDDDKFILELCSTILTKYAIQHKTFSSPKDLLNEPVDHQLSHLLMDMRMPVMTGSELRKIMVERLAPDIKIIAFTAQALPHERKNIVEEGFDALLMKPFKEKELLYALGNSDKSKIDTKEPSHILQLFITDTLADLSELKAAVKQKNSDQAENLFHRLAGRTAQLGQDRIAFQLRKCEIDTRNDELTPLLEVIQIEKQLLDFIQQLKVEAATS